MTSAEYVGMFYMMQTYFTYNFQALGRHIYAALAVQDPFGGSLYSVSYSIVEMCCNVRIPSQQI